MRKLRAFKSSMPRLRNWMRSRSQVFLAAVVVVAASSFCAAATRFSQPTTIGLGTGVFFGQP